MLPIGSDANFREAAYQLVSSRFVAFANIVLLSERHAAVPDVRARKERRFMNASLTEYMGSNQAESATLSTIGSFSYCWMFTAESLDFTRSRPEYPHHMTCHVALMGKASSQRDIGDR
jgi:hypothetical protein